MERSTDDRIWWTAARGDGPVVATAIHDGHGLRPEVRESLLLTDAERLREEDPYTGEAVAGVPNHVVACRSRFEADLNRGAAEAVYVDPSQCWGLQIWRTPPGEALLARSRALHASFYGMMRAWLDEIAAAHGRFVLLDVHSYNHRRDGPTAPPTPTGDAPDINIGTFSMPRDHWAPVLEPVIEAMRGFDFNGRRLDVRENVAFQGKGELARFVHANWPERGCAIAIEFKKFYMDEWTGVPDPAEQRAMRAFIESTAAAAAEALG